MEAVPLSKPQLQALAYKVAEDDGLNAAHFVGTIQCESGWDTNAIGDRGTSIGLAQIHLPDHSDVKKEQATDPRFAIHYMASQWLLGHESEWSCWRDRYGGVE